MVTEMPPNSCMAQSKFLKHYTKLKFNETLIFKLLPVVTCLDLCRACNADSFKYQNNQEQILEVLVLSFCANINILSTFEGGIS